MNWTGRYEGYNAASFRKDLISGLIVGIIAIPLGMAFAIASGVSPKYGIYTTIVAGILISLIGGSRLQIGGPTGAFIPILFAIVMQYGYENLLIAGMMAGVILVLMGLLRLGILIKFFPHPVTVGFTAGIAVIIFSGQISNFLGLSGMEKHEYFGPNMKEIVLHIGTINLYSVLTALLCLAVILVTPKLLPKVPGSLAGLAVSGLVASLLFQGKVDTIGSVYGAIPSSLPQFQLPEITLDKVEMLIGPAFIIALLGAVESLLSAVVADGMTGDRHNSNRELIGQGVANIAAPLFGGIPATGAIARTAANIRTGAVSPMSGVIHGVVVLLVLLLFAPLASYIPLASMAPILMVVAWNMSDRKQFAHLLKTRTSDSMVLLLTFLLTVFTNLTTAVEAGLAASVLLFVYKMNKMLIVSKGHADTAGICSCKLEGPMFFGTANVLEQAALEMLHQKPAVLILRMRGVSYMDTTGESHLANLAAKLKKDGSTLLVEGIQPQPLSLLRRTGLDKAIGEKRFFNHEDEALRYASQLAGLQRQTRTASAASTAVPAVAAVAAAIE